MNTKYLKNQPPLVWILHKSTKF